MHQLDEATRAQRLEDDRFAVDLSPKYWGYTAAHGGYLAAVLLRAMVERVADASRHPRSLTVHFLKGPQAGAAEVHTEVLRTGGKLTSMTARLMQQGAPTTFAVAAFGADFDGEGFQQRTMPEVPAPEACVRMQPSKVEIDHRFEHRPCFGGAPFSGAKEAWIGGHSRLEAPREIDALTLTLLCDAWWPALFPTLTDKKQAGACPTIDLTIHFRADLPLQDAAPDDYVLVELRTEALAHGYLDESCRIWSKGGVLLAQTVQHAARLRPK